MPVLASTVDEYFTDAMSIAANNTSTTSLGTSPSLNMSTNSDDLFSMGSLLSDDIWNKFGLDTASDLFNFDLKELLDEEEKAAMSDMILLNEVSSGGSTSSCGNESDSSNSSSWPFLNFDDIFEIRNHDCMWAGHCGSKEHPTDEQPLVRPITAPVIAARQSIQQSLRGESTNSTTITNSSPIINNKPTTINQTQVPAGRSVLLKTVKQQQQQQQQSQSNVQVCPNNGGFSPDTPPMSDDEEIKAKTSPVPCTSTTQQDSVTSTLQMLQSAIDDYDLLDYLEDKGDDLLKESEALIEQEIDDNEETDDGLPDEEEEEEEAMAHEEKRNQQQRVREVFNQFPSDHCYHKGTSLAYETPSDSDDEIDVVSISDPPAAPQPQPRYPRGHLSYHQLQQLQQQHKRSAQHNNLPYNPSTRDRHQLQRTVANVMSNKKMVGNGQQFNNIRVEQQSPTPSASNNYPLVKTLLPLHRNSQSSSQTTPRRTYNNQTHHTPLAHGGKRKHPSSNATSNSHKYTSSSSASLTTPKYTRKRAHYHNSSDSEPETSEKRSLHNNMERQRRIDLRNAFEYLRVLVPEVNKRERAAKVVILREARVYCNRLTSMDEDYHLQIDELKEHQERLRSRVSQLRRSLANKHR